MRKYLILSNIIFLLRVFCFVLNGITLITMTENIITGDGLTNKLEVLVRVPIRPGTVS